MTSLKLATSLRTTIKPTSVHCEERRTIRTDHNFHSSTGPRGYAHLFGSAREPTRTLTLLSTCLGKKLNGSAPHSSKYIFQNPCVVESTNSSVSLLWHLLRRKSSHRHGYTRLPLPKDPSGLVLRAVRRSEFESQTDLRFSPVDLFLTCSTFPSSCNLL